MTRRKIINARLQVAIPFRTVEEREKFLSVVEERADRTIGEVVLDIIREELRRRDEVKRLTGQR